MRNRQKAGRGAKRQFTNTAKRVHKKNFQAGPMRGGIRL